MCCTVAKVAVMSTAVVVMGAAVVVMGAAVRLDELEGGECVHLCIELRLACSNAHYSLLSGFLIGLLHLVAQPQPHRKNGLRWALSRSSCVDLVSLRHSPWY